jgi:hypothetical protein
LSIVALEMIENNANLPSVGLLTKFYIDTGEK